MVNAWDSDVDSVLSTSCSGSSLSSLDEDVVNRRMTPYWPSYLNLFKAHGFRLDTIRDVKQYYDVRGSAHLPYAILHSPSSDYSRVHKSEDDDALCPDYGLPDNLFRGTRIIDDKKIVTKAVHLHSREYDIIRLLSSPPLQDDPMNHTIRPYILHSSRLASERLQPIAVLDFIEVPKDNLAFIVMEQWSSQLIHDEAPCSLTLFLAAIRQSIEHAAFMHGHHIAHLDISLRNLLTDYRGHCAYIDYELSRRFDGIDQPHVYGCRGTEIPPEFERAERADPYKVDVWALGVLILRACQVGTLDAVFT
ncbi:hypothetical protein AX17_003391 [Amanita inopinata Kibby_2008]|nr:hypothetical protein AX17_003391 [Amanita inopinata Kibby_2008]